MALEREIDTEPVGGGKAKAKQLVEWAAANEKQNDKTINKTCKKGKRDNWKDVKGEESKERRW